MEQDRELQIEDILNSMREQIGRQAQEIAVLNATINTLQRPVPRTTTAVTDKPDVVGTQGIKP